MQHDCSRRNRERAGMPLTSYTNYIPAICHICWLISLHFRQETLSEGTAAARKRGRPGAQGGAACAPSPGASSPRPGPGARNTPAARQRGPSAL